MSGREFQAEGPA